MHSKINEKNTILPHEGKSDLFILKFKQKIYYGE